MADQQPTFHKGIQGDYIPAFYPGENTSGLKVFGKNVLLAVDEFSPTSAGGIEFLEDYVEKKTAAAETGCIFATGPEAFRQFDDGSKWSGDKPELGDRVYFEKYAGLIAKGMDGRTYRIMDYRAIGAGLDKDYVARQQAEADNG